MSLLKKMFGNDEVDKNIDDDISVDQNQTGINFYNKSKKIGEVGNNMKTKYSVLKPKRFSDSQEILNLIKTRLIVTFCIENLTKEEGQRLVDLVSGSTHAMSGKLIQITERVYTSVPEGMEILEVDKSKEEI